jgi:hypothetical protein
MKPWKMALASGLFRKPNYGEPKPMPKGVQPMRHLTAILILVVSMLLAQNAAAVENLLVNGGFENGNWSGWTRGGSNGYSTISTEDPYGGTYCMRTVAGYLWFYQDFPTIPGQRYNVSFAYVGRSGGEYHHCLQAGWNNKTFFAQDYIQLTQWSHKSFTLEATGTSTRLQFWYDYGGGDRDYYPFYVDAVYVTPVATVIRPVKPQPGIQLLLLD